MKNINLKNIGTDNFFVEEAYKILRTNIQFCGSGVKTITVTSCGENDGKTTIVLNLGKSFSELNKKVLIIDCDMRKSVTASRNSDAVNVKGLSEYLSGLVTIDDVCAHTQYNGFDIIFAGRVPPNPVELLNSEEFSHLLKWGRENYDYVLIDTPPLGVVIDAAVIGPQSDGAAIIINEGVHSKIVDEVISQFKKSQTKILGFIRNKAEGDKSKHRYHKKHNNN